MNGEHYEEHELLAWLDGDAEIVDLDAVSAHLLMCSSCGWTMDELRALTNILSDPFVHLYAQRRSRSAARFEAQASFATNVRDNGDTARAELTFAELMEQPVESWQAYLDIHAEKRTAALMRRLIAAARPEFDRRAEYALAILAVAADVAGALDDGSERAAESGAVAKERANALRMLGRHTEALEALDSAEQLLSQLPAPSYDLTFIEWARATVLFDMTRYGDAQPIAQRVIESFEHFGDTDHATQARVLMANILCEQGLVTTARDLYIDLLRYFSDKHDAGMIAMLHGNLAECEVRLDRLDTAQKYATRAIRAFDSLGKPSERVRVEWTLGYRLYRQGHHELALELLRSACAGFESLNMAGAAGSVGLDIAELHIARGEWQEAEQLARYLYKMFSSTSAPVYAARAFAYLHEAVAHRTATIELIDYLRVYVEKEDDAATFSPPPGG